MARKIRHLTLLTIICAGLASSAFATSPIINSLSQGSGAVGASITIGGTDFGATQGSSTVTFNGTAATTITSWSDTSIIVAVPSGSTTGNLVVMASGVASDGVAFTVTPSITSLSSNSGGVGMSVTITGSNFGSSQGTSIVQFSSGQTTATPTSWSATSIVTPIPVGASIGLVSVNVAGYLSNGLNFTVLPTPTITSLSPNSGPIGTWITITGTNFGTTQGSSAVTFNGTDVTTITSWSATNITLAVPLGTTTGNTVVTVGGVPSAGVVFTEITAPSMPSVVQVRPVDGASNVNLNSRVVLRFSQPVQPVSLVNGVFTLSQGSSPVSGSVVQSNPEYTGTVYDTGAGWNSTHHNVPPDAWVDIWISPCKQARTYGIRYRKVTICCKDCK